MSRCTDVAVQRQKGSSDLMIFDALAARRGVRTVRASVKLTLSCIAMATLSTGIAHSATSTVQTKINKADIVRQLGQLQIPFEPNVGQADPRVDYVSHGGSYSLMLTPGSAILELSKQTSAPALHKLPRFESSYVSMNLLGASRSHGVAQDKLTGKANYITGSDRKLWHTNIPTYGRVNYPGVYPGIDLTYYGTNSHLEYDFTVAPGADPGKVTLRFDGAKHQVVDPSGRLVLNLATAPVAWEKPVAYQMSNGVRQFVDARYVLSAGTVKIAVGKYDRSRSLVIDPILNYGTYFPAASINGIAVSASGIYVAGYATTFAYPQTVGNGSPPSVAVSEFSSTLVPKLVFSTMLGFTGSVTALTVDQANDIYIGGQATGTGLATTPNAPQGTPSTDNTGFLAELNPSGSIVTFGTYIGGSGADIVTAISAFEKTGTSGVTTILSAVGSTDSSNFPVSPGAQQSNATNGFIATFTTTNSTSAEDYASYIGGTNGVDTPTGVASDPTSQNVFVTGVANSTNINPIGNDSIGIPGPGANGFLYEINALGGASLYSSYINGVQPSGISFVPSSSDVYLGGTVVNFTTYDPGTVITGGIAVPPGTTPKGSLFVNAYNTTAAVVSALSFSTEFGGTVVYDLASTNAVAAINNLSPTVPYGGYTTDVNGNSYFTGVAGSNVPTSADALQASSANVAGNIPFFGVLNSTGTAVTELTYFGGTDTNINPQAIAADGNGNIFIGGTTSAFDMLTTPGVYEQTPDTGFVDSFSLTPFSGPQINYFSPTSAFEGTAQTTVELVGSGFTPTTTVSLSVNGVAQTAPTIAGQTATVLSVVVPSSVLAVPKTPAPYDVDFTVSNGTQTYSLNFPVVNPNPTVTSASPSPIELQFTPLTLDIFGTNFKTNTTVTLEGQKLTIKSQTSTELDVVVPEMYVSQLGTLDFIVANPNPSNLPAEISDTVVDNSPEPLIEKLIPASVDAGSGAFTLEIQGIKFNSACTVTVDDTVPGSQPTTVYTPTTFSTTDLTIPIPASSDAAAGTLSVTVNNPTSSGANSNTVDLPVITPPTPVIFPTPAVAVTPPAQPLPPGLSPNSVYAGSPSIILTISGTGFNPESQVVINGVYYKLDSGSPPTQTVSYSVLTTTVPASILGTSGSYTVFVDNGAAYGGASNKETFYVDATPSPVVLSSITPSQVVSGTTGLEITLTGSGFYPQSEVTLNGSPLNPLLVTFINGTTIQVDVPDNDIASAIASPGIPITVVNASPDGTDGGTSQTLYLSVISNAAPTITSVSPTAVAMGSGDQPITITGTNFNSLSVVSFNGTVATIALGQTTTQLVATLPAADDASSGFVTITVTNPAPGGGTATAQLAVDQPQPVLGSLVVSGPGTLTSTYTIGTTQKLTLSGSGFTSSSVINLSGTAAGQSAVTITVPPTTQTSSVLTLTIPATLPANSGVIEVSVTNPAPINTANGTGTSAALPFNLTYPAPTLTGISPILIPQGTIGQVLTLTGSGFASGDSVAYNAGTSTDPTTYPTTYVSANTLTTIVPTTITATTGAQTIQVSAPGITALSAAETFTITPVTITAFTLSPATVVGGNAVSGTVTLGSTAPAGGVSVALSLTSGPASSLLLPTSILVPAGSNTATITNIQTHVVTGTVNDVITATVGNGTGIPASLTITGLGGGTFGSGLQFFSVPYTYNDTIEDIFVNPLAAPGQIATYNAAANPPAYTYQGGSPTSTVSLSVGIGYWAEFQLPSTTTVGGVTTTSPGGDSLLYLGTPASSTVPTTVTLNAGWNSIGDPYTTAVNVNDLTFSGGQYTFATAVSPTLVLISPILYFFVQDTSGVSGGYNTTGAGDTLSPGVGYWIYAYSATDITYPLPASTVTPTTGTSGTTTTTTTTTTGTTTGTTKTGTFVKRIHH